MLTLLLTFVLSLCATPVHAAEFDIDSGRVILRQLQYCTDCGSALLVTNVQPGTLIRCPDCGHEQHRLQNRHVLTQMYQMCKLCQSPLDPTGHHPGEIVACDNCHTKQSLSKDAFSLGDLAGGPGYAPGFPPGTGKKKLLLSPNKPGAPITVVPFDDDSHLAEASGARDTALTRVMPPPKEHTPIREEVRRKEYPPIPDAPAQTRRPAPPQPPAEEPREAVRDMAMDVPAVTADLFGGRHTEAGGREDHYIPTGKVLARVDGEPVYARDVDRVVNPVVERLRQQASPQEMEQVAAREKTLRGEILHRLIDRELAMREALAIGYKPDPAAIREREGELAQVLAGSGVDIRREATRDVVMNAMRRRFAEKPGSANPEAVREFYRQHKDQMLQPRLVALDQLVVYQDRTDQPDKRNYQRIAMEVSEALEQGVRFDEARERYDEFTHSAGVTHAEPVLQPESAYARQVLMSAGDLRMGAVFGPLFMSGMALFGKVSDVRPAGPIPFEEVKADIQRRLENEAAERNLDDWLRRLRGKAKVELLPQSP